jgi:molybdopterin-dependent oxidoreductase alpha subunit
MSEERIPEAENPEDFTGLKQENIKHSAGGIPAVVSALKHVLPEAGFVRGLKALGKINQKDGFDCPGCAWPDPDDERSGIAEYCENGAKAIAEEATLKKLDPEFFATHSIEELASWSDYQIGKSGRLSQPMILSAGDNHYRPVTWSDAFDKIASELNSLDSPDEAIFYTSGRTSNEAAFLYQLFVREFGTNNLPDCSNMCHESSGVALGESLGIGKGSVTLEDFYEAQVIFILGQNPGTNHPRMLTALQKAKRNGALIISANPLPEAGLMAFNNPQELKGLLDLDSKLTDLFLQVRINGDFAMLLAIEKKLLEANSHQRVFDAEFINRNTIGYDALTEHLSHLDIEELYKISGLSPEQIGAAADILKDKERIIACWAMGLTQHKNAVNTIKEIVNLLLLKGSIGKRGAGTCPVRGHSNVQGDRTMGIVEKPSERFLQKIKDNFGFMPPSQHGLDTVESIKAMYAGKGKVFIALGGNFLSATPDTQFTAAALQKTRLTVHISTKLNRSHLVHGREAIILPALGRSDLDFINGVQQFISCENSMGVVQASKGTLKPASEHMLSEPVIVCRLAKATLSKSKVSWDKYLQHYDQIREDIERTIPGFENYNERVRNPGGFYLPNVNRAGLFDTATKKAHFNIAMPGYIETKADELTMMTIRSHDQFNTTIYGLNDRYRGINNERRVILMNKNDLQKRGLQNGSVVTLVNEHDGTRREAHNFIAIDYPIPEGNAATYFPEANVLVPISSVAEKSNTPTSKMVIIKVIPSGARL